MRLKESNNFSYSQMVKKCLPAWLKSKKFIVAILLTFIVLSLIITSPVIALLWKYKATVKKKLNSQIETMAPIGYFKAPFYYVKSLAVHQENIAIDIKYTDLQKLSYMRKIALEAQDGVENAQYFDYVPAAISYKGQSHSIYIRLKGDRNIHIEHKEQWSFRVKVRKNKTILGMRKFSLQKPRARNYIYEWLFHEVLKREGLISLRYIFVNLSLNGKNLGSYALEEHFDKRLIENNQLREGAIVRFTEDLGPIFHISAIEPFGKKVLLADGDGQQLNFKRAVSLLEAFRQKKMKVSQVFDVKKMAKYFAITDFLGVHHGSLSKSVRFYCNPVTSKLEPIGFDGHYGAEPTIHLAAELGLDPAAGWFYEYYRDWYKLFFSDKEMFDVAFYKEYIEQLEKFSDPYYLENLFDDIDEDLQKNLALIYKDFPPFADHITFFGPDIFNFSKKGFLKRQQYIRETLNPTKAMHAYYKGTADDHIVLELGNVQKIPLEIISVSYKDRVLLASGENMILHPKPVSGFIEFEDIFFRIPEGLIWSDPMAAEVAVNYRILGISTLESETVYPYSHLDMNLIKNEPLRQEYNFEEFAFIDTDEKNKQILIKTETCDLDRNLIIPPGYTVTCFGGTQLNLRNSAKIISYSPLLFTGSEAKPIVIKSSDATGQGIVVLNADRDSTLEYVIFENLFSPSETDWQLTGSVTFYESNVTISHCQFRHNYSEDALNIIRSEFSIDETTFYNTFSDAFDADFCKGSITASFFANLGNDAIDVSGTELRLQNIRINDAGDKGLSIGEESYVTASQIIIKDSEIAVTSKDMSELIIKDVDIRNCKIGFTVFQKKSEFGPARILADDVKLDLVELQYLIENGSKVFVDGQEKEPSRKNVKEILYGREYGKSSN